MFALKSNILNILIVTKHSCPLIEILILDKKFDEISCSLIPRLIALLSKNIFFQDYILSTYNDKFVHNFWLNVKYGGWGWGIISPIRENSMTF